MQKHSNTFRCLRIAAIGGGFGLLTTGLLCAGCNNRQTAGAPEEPAAKVAAPQPQAGLSTKLPALYLDSNEFTDLDKAAVGGPKKLVVQLFREKASVALSLAVYPGSLNGKLYDAKKVKYAKPLADSLDLDTCGAVFLGDQQTESRGMGGNRKNDFKQLLEEVRTPANKVKYVLFVPQVDKATRHLFYKYYGVDNLPGKTAGLTTVIRTRTFSTNPSPPATADQN